MNKKKKNKITYLKKLIKKLFKINVNKKEIKYPEYDNETKINKIKEAIDNNVLTKEACQKALTISCDFNDKEVNNAIKKLYKNIKEEKIKKTKEDILVSFIIPTYKRKKELNQCLESILMQTYKNYEIIIVDDNSPDETDKFINKNYSKYKKIKYFKNETNQGPNYNRKYGFKKASGKYIIFCDDDDFYIDPYFLQRAVNILKDNKKENISFVSFTAFGYPEKTKLLHRHILDSNFLNNNKEYINDFLIRNKKPLSTFTTLFKKDTLKNNGLEEMEMVDDTMIYLCALLSNKCIISNQIVGMYRITQSSISSNIKVEFVINLLKELKNISLKIKETNNPLDLDKWWEERVISILNWAINKRYYSPKEIKKIIRFVNKNTNKNKFKLIKKIIVIWLNS